MFELPPELALGKPATAARTASAVLAAALGLFLLFFAILIAAANAGAGDVLAIVLALVGFALIALAATTRRAGSATGATELVVDDRGLRLGRPGGRSVEVDWNDPSLKVDLREFTTDRASVLPPGDPRLAHPQWISFYRPPRRSPREETGLPVEAIAAVLHAAEEHGVTVRPVKVGFYWYHVARGPGFLAYEVEGDLVRATGINGRITRLRGTAWNSYPDE